MIYPMWKIWVGCLLLMFAYVGVVWIFFRPRQRIEGQNPEVAPTFDPFMRQRRKMERGMTEALKNSPGIMGMVDRSIKIKQIANRYISKIDGDKFLFPLRALLISGVDSLNDEDELDELCDLVREAGRDDPFPEWGSWSKIPHGNRLAFLKTANKEQQELKNAQSAMRYYESLLTTGEGGRVKALKDIREHEELQRQRENRDALIRSVRDGLGKRLYEGDKLLQFCRKEDQLRSVDYTPLDGVSYAAESKCVEWDELTTGFLRAHFGEAYVLQYLSSIDCNHAPPTKGSALTINLYARLAWLKEFLKNEFNWPPDLRPLS